MRVPTAQNLLLKVFLEFQFRHLRELLCERIRRDREALVLLGELEIDLRDHPTYGHRYATKRHRLRCCWR